MPGVIGRLLERAYRFEVARRHRAFDAGVGVRDVGVPVISIGNMSVGGTGKTPMVRTVARWLSEAGHRPAIALRGYKAKRGVSDEAAEYARELPGVPIAVGGDRFAAIGSLRDRLGGEAFDCIVLDDGFQHRRLTRALDVVLLDATRWPLRDRCLPAGWLREPVEGLARAQVAVITRADRARGKAGWEGLAAELRSWFGHLHIAACVHRWDGFAVGPGAGRVEPVEWLRGRAVVIACGIGNPGAFVGQAIAAGPVVREIVRKGDHHDWSARDARRLSAELERAGGDAVLLTTGKDWVKLDGVADGSLRERVVLPRLSLRFLMGEVGVREGVVAAVQGGGEKSERE